MLGSLSPLSPMTLRAPPPSRRHAVNQIILSAHLCDADRNYFTRSVRPLVAHISTLNSTLRHHYGFPTFRRNPFSATPTPFSSPIHRSGLELPLVCFCTTIKPGPKLRKSPTFPASKSILLRRRSPLSLFHQQHLPPRLLTRMPSVSQLRTDPRPQRPAPRRSPIPTLLLAQEASLPHWPFSIGNHFSNRRHFSRIQ